MAHRVVLAAERAEAVGEVVVQRGGAMAVARRLALRERLLGERERVIELAGVLQREREIVERRDVRLAIAELLRDRDARLEVCPRAGGAEDAEDVVRLRERVLVLRSLRQAEGLAGQTLRSRLIAGAMGREAPVREDPGLLAALARLVRRRVAALGVRPVAAAVVDLGELVLDRGPPARRSLGGGRLVALDRAAVIALQRVPIADRLGGRHARRRDGLREGSPLDRGVQRAGLRDGRDAELPVQDPRRLG